MIYSFDPGKTTGVAIGTEAGSLSRIEQYSVPELYVFLNQLTAADTFIIENFTIRPNKASSFVWSSMEVIQIIGALKYCAFQVGADVIMQEPTVKVMGYKWAGIVPPSNHKLSHEADAYAHMVFYWVKQLGLEAPVMRKLRNEKTSIISESTSGAGEDRSIDGGRVTP